MPPELKDQESETQSLDMEAATAQISDELFGQGGESEDDQSGIEVPSTAGEKDPSGAGSNAPKADVGTSPQTDKEPAASAAPQSQADGAAAGSDNSAAVQAVGAPKTWTKDALAAWAAIPNTPEKDRILQEIGKREEDFLRGIGQYKEAANLGAAYDKVVEPFKPMLAAENVDPVQLFQSFASNHYLLSRGTPAQKVELAAALINGYQIPLADLLNHIADGGGQGPKPVAPEVQQLRDEITQLKNFQNQRAEQERAAFQESALNEIKAFENEKDANGNLLHPYFLELTDDITQLFKTGAASNPAEAYELAVFRNPTYRQKEIDRLTAERTSAAAAEQAVRDGKVAKSTAEQVRSTPKSKDGTVPTGSMDDTLQETLADIRARA